MKTGFKLGSSDGIASLMQSKLTSRKIKLSNIVKDEYQVRSKFNDETIELSPYEYIWCVKDKNQSI